MLIKLLNIQFLTVFYSNFKPDDRTEDINLHFFLHLGYKTATFPYYYNS